MELPPYDRPDHSPAKPGCLTQENGQLEAVQHNQRVQKPGDQACQKRGDQRSSVEIANVDWRRLFPSDHRHTAARPLADNAETVIGCSV